MLNRNSRIKRELFSALLARGAVVGYGATTHLRTKVFKLPLEESEAKRFSVVISSKTVKRAVGRNKIKRRLRAVIYKHLAELIPGRATIIWVKSAELATRPFPQVETEVVELLEKARLLNKK